MICSGVDLEWVSLEIPGEIVPANVLDVRYEGVESGSFAEEALMVFLRLITA